MGRDKNMNLMPGRVGRDLGGLLSFPLFVGAIAIFEGVIFAAIRKYGLWLWFGMAITIAIIGIALLAYARFPLYQQKKFLSVGPNAIPEERKAAYKLAWLLVLVAILIQVLLLRLIR